MFMDPKPYIILLLVPRFGLRTHRSCAIPGPNSVAAGCSTAVAVASIRVETDDLQLLLGFWPCLIDRDSQQSHVHRFPTVRWSWFSACVHLACSKQSRYVEISSPLFPFFHLNAAFICLQPSVLCLLQPILPKRSAMEGS